MTLLRLLYYYLWTFPHILQVVLFALLVRRGLYRQFPMFALYTAFEVCQFSVLFVVNQVWGVTSNQYLVAFAAGIAISTILRFGVIYEVFCEVLRSYKVLSRFGTQMFRWATVLLLVLAVGLAAVIQGGTVGGWLTVLAVLDRSVSILQCGLLLFLFLFSKYFSLSWRNLALGIALGSGIFASVELATSAIRERHGSSELLDFIVLGTYHACVMIWLLYVLLPEKKSGPPPGSLLENLPEHDLELWSRELERLAR